MEHPRLKSEPFDAFSHHPFLLLLTKFLQKRYFFPVSKPIKDLLLRPTLFVLFVTLSNTKISFLHLKQKPYPEPIFFYFFLLSYRKISFSISEHIKDLFSFSQHIQNPFLSNRKYKPVKMSRKRHRRIWQDNSHK